MYGNIGGTDKPLSNLSFADYNYIPGKCFTQVLQVQSFHPTCVNNIGLR